MTKCAFCGRTEEDAYDIIPRESDGQLECVDCWHKRENAADKRRVTITAAAR